MNEKEKDSWRERLDKDHAIFAGLANITLDKMTMEGSKPFAATHPPDLPVRFGSPFDSAANKEYAEKMIHWAMHARQSPDTASPKINGLLNRKTEEYALNRAIQSGAPDLCALPAAQTLLKKQDSHRGDFALQEFHAQLVEKMMETMPPERVENFSSRFHAIKAMSDDLVGGSASTTPFPAIPSPKSDFDPVQENLVARGRVMGLSEEDLKWVEHAEDLQARGRDVDQARSTLLFADRSSKGAELLVSSHYAGLVAEHSLPNGRIKPGHEEQMSKDLRVLRQASQILEDSRSTSDQQMNVGRRVHNLLEDKTLEGYEKFGRDHPATKSLHAAVALTGQSVQMARSAIRLLEQDDRSENKAQELKFAIDYANTSMDLDFARLNKSSLFGSKTLNVDVISREPLDVDKVTDAALRLLPRKSGEKRFSKPQKTIHKGPEIGD